MKFQTIGIICLEIINQFDAVIRWIETIKTEQVLVCDGFQDR